MAALSNTARRGLSSGPTPTANGWSGVISRSAARRWSVRGAPSIEAMADDNVAAITPRSINRGETDKRRMMAVSPCNSARGTAITKVTTTNRYTTVETAIARNVPCVMLRLGVRRSPDMATPWVNPVMAGKKMANATQKDPPPSGLSRFSDIWSNRRSGITPIK